MKDNRNEVAALINICDQFLEKVSFRKESQSGFVLYQSHVGSTEYIPSIDWRPENVILDPVGPVKTKGHPKIATGIRFGIDTSSEKRQKRSCDYCREQRHINWMCKMYDEYAVPAMRPSLRYSNASVNVMKLNVMQLCCHEHQKNCKEHVKISLISS